MRRLFAIFACLFFATPTLSQDKRPPIHKADQISMTIDVLGNIRAAVTKYPLDRRLNLYRAVSLRLTRCGLMYIMLNKETKQDAQTSATFDGVGRVYTLAGSVIHPESGVQYQKMLEEASADIIRMKETNDRNRPVIIMKSCQALAESEDDAAKAVAQLIPD